MEEDREKFKLLKETLDPEVDSVSMYYNAGIDEYGNVTLRYRRNRLLKRSRQFQWHGDVHNYIAVWGNIINSDIAVTHLKRNTPLAGTSPFTKKNCEWRSVFTPGLFLLWE